MCLKTKAAITAVYGAWLAAAGVWRFVDAGSGKALGFGLAMAAMAFVAAGCLAKGKARCGTIVGAITLLFVVGFFAKKSSEEGIDLRVGLILAASAIEAAVLAWPRRST